MLFYRKFPGKKAGNEKNKNFFTLKIKKYVRGSDERLKQQNFPLWHDYCNISLIKQVFSTEMLLALLKTKRERRTRDEEAKKAIKLLGGEITDIIEYQLDYEDSDRTLIVIKKISPTTKKYPRGGGKPKNKPL